MENVKIRPPDDPEGSNFLAVTMGYTLQELIDERKRLDAYIRLAGEIDKAIEAHKKTMERLGLSFSEKPAVKPIDRTEIRTGKQTSRKRRSSEQWREAIEEQLDGHPEGRRVSSISSSLGVSDALVNQKLRELLHHGVVAQPRPQGPYMLPHYAPPKQTTNGQPAEPVEESVHDV